MLIMLSNNQNIVREFHAATYLQPQKSLPTCRQCGLSSWHLDFSYVTSSWVFYLVSCPCILERRFHPMAQSHMALLEG